MRLMGTARLEGLANSETEGVAGAISALMAELVAGRWADRAEFQAHFPLATTKNTALRIPVGDKHCVDLIINYSLGMVLISFAGVIALDRRITKTGKKAA